MLPAAVSLAPFYGGGIQWLCNQAQRTGLLGHVADFRLRSRAIYLNPFLEFLYWHMNYHVEHHMYAALSAGADCNLAADLQGPNAPKG